MAIDQKNYLEIARNRYTQQFKDKPNFDSLVETWLRESTELQSVISDIDDIKYIDRAKGTQLDNIGEIVGQPRLLIDADLIAFFGFQGLSVSRSYGDLEDPSKGGRWFSLGESTTGNILLSDEEYRLFIRAKIIRNSTVATTEDVIDSIKFLFQADRVHLIEGENPASYRIAIGKVLSQQEKNLIKYDYQEGVKRTLVVKPAGVNIDQYSEYNPNQFFSFEGVTGGKGYGNLREVGEYVPYYTSFGMFGYGDLSDIADISTDVSYKTFSRHSTTQMGISGTSVTIPNQNAVKEVYVGGSFENDYIISGDTLYFNSQIPVDTNITIVERYGQEIVESNYSFKDPQVTTLSSHGLNASFGDVNDPSLGSRYKSLGENDTANNILNEGPIKKIEYFTDPPEDLQTGGIYSTIVT